MARMSDGSELLGNLREEFRHLPAGSRVPTIREISGRYAISQFSVQRAFEALKEEGFIQSFVGRGSFAVGRGTATNSSTLVKQARILIVSHSTPSSRGNDITTLLQSLLQSAGHKLISVSYSDVADLKDLLGRGGFDICVLQPRRSVLPVEVLALLRSKASHMIVEGRQLEQTDVDVYLRNRAKSIAIALSHLRGLGHEDIGLLTERPDAAAGYAEIENLYMQSYGSYPDRPPAPIVRVGIDRNGTSNAEYIGHALKEELNGRSAAPSAFIVSGRFGPAEISEGFRRANLEIPKDVSAVHLRSASEDDPGGGGFTRVGRSAHHVASGIADIVKWRLANPAEPAGLVLDDPRLVVGRTTTPMRRG